jgi:hypothetical protein
VDFVAELHADVTSQPFAEQKPSPAGIDPESSFSRRAVNSAEIEIDERPVEFNVQRNRGRLRFGFAFLSRFGRGARESEAEDPSERDECGSSWIDIHQNSVRVCAATNETVFVIWDRLRVLVPSNWIALTHAHA